MLHKKKFWDDLCNHSNDCYVGSADFNSFGSPDKVDVYVYNYNSVTCDLQQVCIRYGNEHSDYISAGEIEHVYSVDGLPLYDLAKAVLRNNGKLIWKHN